MPRYCVTVISGDGDNSVLEFEASTVEELFDVVTAAGYTVVSAEEIESSESFEIVRVQANGSASPAPRTHGSAAPGPLTHQEARDFAHHLAGLSHAGLPLPDGLRALRDELPQGSLRRLVGDLADRLERGESLEAALNDLGRHFPGHLGNLILAGARSGRLDEVLNEFVNYSLVGASLRRSIWVSLAYPAIMITIYTGVFCFLSFVVVRGFEAIFKDFGIPLPWMTQLLLVSSRTMVDAGWALIVAPLVAIVAIALAARFLLEPSARFQLLQRLPIFGALSRWTSMAEFAHYLGLLLECEIPLPFALPLAAEGASSKVLVHASREVAKDVADGMPLADSFARWNVFPRGFAKLLRWADGHQSLPETLHMTAEMIQARARAHAAFISSVCGIISVIIILWSCAFVVVALFYPLLQLLWRLM
jgi:general secretion pathway protein F